jgi:hypothetical protein
MTGVFLQVFGAHASRHCSLRQRREAIARVVSKVDAL